MTLQIEAPYIPSMQMASTSHIFLLSISWNLAVGHQSLAQHYVGVHCGYSGRCFQNDGWFLIIRTFNGSRECLLQLVVALYTIWTWAWLWFYCWANMHRICVGIYGKMSIKTHRTAVTLHWRHNDHGGVSNHQPHGCLLNRLFRRRSEKTSKLRVIGLFAGNSPRPVNSPHKGPVTRKMVPFDDVIMQNDCRYDN